jgi:hypothetical protein
MYAANGRVGDELFSYDRRTGAILDSAPGAYQFFKGLKKINDVSCYGDEFTVKLTTLYNMSHSEFIGIDPTTHAFFDITHDPRVVIPAILTSDAFNLWLDRNTLNRKERRAVRFAPPALLQAPAHLARCTVQHVSFTYNTKTGEERYNPDTFGMDAPIKYPCSAVESVTRRETRFIVCVRYMGVTQYDSVKYDATDDTFDRGMAYDPRIIIPAIRNSSCFIEIFGHGEPSSKPLDDEQVLYAHPDFGKPATYRYNDHEYNNPPSYAKTTREPHIKYVDIDGVRVVYDARTGDELDLKAEGPIKSALYIDDCQSLFQDEYEFMVTFTSGTSEHMCRVVYDYNTGLFSGLTADPRIIIPYVRASPEFKSYAAIYKKKLTDAGQVSLNPMINAVISRNRPDDDPKRWLATDPWPSDPYDDTQLSQQISKLNSSSVQVSGEPEILDEPHATRLYENFINRPDLPKDDPPYSQWMQDVLGGEIEEPSDDEREIKHFNSLSGDQQCAYLITKRDIIRLKLQQRRDHLVTQLKNPVASVVIEPVPPAVKFTPRENNLEVFDFDIREWNLPQKLVVDGNITVEHADIGTAELVQLALPAS